MFTIKESLTTFTAAQPAPKGSAVAKAAVVRVEERAYYAGAAAVLEMLFALNEHSPDAAAGILDGLRTEANAYFGCDTTPARLLHGVAEGRA